MKLSFNNCKLEYKKPYCILPENFLLHSKPIDYFKLVSDILLNHGFVRESQELLNLSQTKYAENFNTLEKFIDFFGEEHRSEDENYIYIKIKKNNIDIRQPVEFSKSIFELISISFDFSIKNCYGRNYLHYQTDSKNIIPLLEENKKTNAIDIFALDQFGSSLLQNQPLSSFYLIFKEMMNHSQSNTKKILYSNNIFGQNSYNHFLNLCRNILKPDRVFPTEDTIRYIVGIIFYIGLLDSESKKNLLSMFEEELEVNPIDKYIVINKMISKYILDFDLSNKSNSERIVKI